jgi:hypothetical protein
MNSLLVAGLIVSVIASLLTAYGRIFRTKREMEKKSDNSKGVNESRMRHKLIETRVAQIGAILLVIGFAMQLIAHMNE